MADDLCARFFSAFQDLVFPTEIVGKRTRCKIDGSKILKVQLDPKDQVRHDVCGGSNRALTISMKTPHTFHDGIKRLSQGGSYFRVQVSHGYKCLQ